MANNEHPSSLIKKHEAPAPPLFIRTPRLNEAEQKEMNEQVTSVEKTCRAINETWEALSDVFGQREEISVARIEAHIRQAKQKRADSFNLTPSRTLMKSDESAVATQTSESAVATRNVGLDEDTARRYYQMWSDELGKIIEYQRRKTRQSVERWFGLLHRLDGARVMKPSDDSKKTPSLFWYGLVILLCSVHALLSPGPDDGGRCEGEPLACFQEIVLDGLVGISNFYLSFHNITIDGTEKAGAE